MSATLVRVRGVFEQGAVRLPADTQIPEGADVLVEWSPEAQSKAKLYEEEEWTEDEVQRDIEASRNPLWTTRPSE
jgi:hypothetical protein